MAKFESPIIVKRKLQAEFGKNTPSEVCIAATFERFCETGTVEYQERSERPPKITDGKVEEVHMIFAQMNPGKYSNCCGSLFDYTNYGASNYDSASLIKAVQGPIRSTTL